MKDSASMQLLRNSIDLSGANTGKTTMLSPKKELAEQSLPSTSAGADAVDLSIEALTRDFVNLIQAVYPEPSRAPSLLVRV